MKCWFLDETQEPEEKPLTAEQRREPYNKLIPHNRELMQLQPSKTRILHLQYSFWYISSPVMRRIRRGISLLSKKSTQVDDFPVSFFWTDLNTDNPFCGMKQWMVVIGNGNFYPWQNRLLISILFITITKFSNLIGYQLSLFQHSRTARAQLNAFFSLLAKRSRTFLCFKFKKGLKYHKCCYSYD